MDAALPSRTAFGVALRRAAHQLFDPPPLILADPIAVRILGPDALSRLEESRKDLDDAFNIALRAFLVARSRYAEDKLAEAVAQGVTQYVLLGAGLDTFAHRNPHPYLRVFELDHPATQQWKRQLAAAAALPHPPSLTYAPCNFESQDLATQLAAAGFNQQAPAFFAWLGVVPYLTLPAFRATLTYIAARSPGSALVFDYGQPSHALPFAERAARKRFAARVARAGEPFQLFFTPKEAAHELNTLADFYNLPGFYNLEDLGTDDLNARYFAHRQDNLRLSGHSARILSAWL